MIKPFPLIRGEVGEGFYISQSLMRSQYNGTCLLSVFWLKHLPSRLGEVTVATWILFNSGASGIPVVSAMTGGERVDLSMVEGDCKEKLAAIYLGGF
jgi:hypothetical protein